MQNFPVFMCKYELTIRFLNPNSKMYFLRKNSQTKCLDGLHLFVRVGLKIALYFICLIFTYIVPLNKTKKMLCSSITRIISSRVKSIFWRMLLKLNQNCFPGSHQESVHDFSVFIPPQRSSRGMLKFGI